MIRSSHGGYAALVASLLLLWGAAACQDDQGANVGNTTVEPAADAASLVDVPEAADVLTAVDVVASDAVRAAGDSHEHLGDGGADAGAVVADAAGAGVDAGVDVDEGTVTDSALGLDTGAGVFKDTITGAVDSGTGQAGDVKAGTLQELVQGVWLIGWSGGMEHYSWVRFASPTSGSLGTAWILDGKAMNINMPLWPCNGKTTWSLGSQPSSVQLHLPSPKCNGKKSILLSFANPVAAGAFPKGAILAVMALANPPLSAFKFADSQCDAAMTSCKDPFK